MSREIVTSENKSKHDLSKLNKESHPEIRYNKDKTFVSAHHKGGMVGGSLKNKELHITHSELDEKERGKGYGKEMYSSLINHAHNLGHKVFSDSTVEMPAVHVYQSLGKKDFDVKRLAGGGELAADKDLPHGALYGKGANSPVFEITKKLAV
jgi:GNAT superfamily N-acetyltransferase